MTWFGSLLSGTLCVFFVVFPGQAASAEENVWFSVSNPPVTVNHHPGFERLADRMATRANEYLSKTSDFLGIIAEGPYLIVMASSKEEFVSLQPTVTAAPEWAGALTYPDLDLVLIMTPGAMESGEGHYWSVVQHEIVHLLVGGAELKNRAKLPVWFQEGLATYISGEMNLPRLWRLGWAQITGTAPSFESLETRFPKQASRAEVAYARSFLFIRYLTRRFGNDSVAGLVRESLARGGLDAGARAVFGVPLEEILQGFAQYARVKGTWIPVLGSAASIWTIITLLFLLAWYRKRVLSLRTIKNWELEEQWLSQDSKRTDETGHTLH